MTTTTKLSRECAFMGKSRTATPSNIIRLRASGRGTPTTVNGKVPPRRTPNRARRSREYLTASEVQALMDAARKTGRHGHRDATLILIAYRHGLRVSELVSLRWDQIDLPQGLLHVARVKNGTPSTPSRAGTRDPGATPLAAGLSGQSLRLQH